MTNKKETLKEFKVRCEYTYIAEDEKDCKELMIKDGLLNDCEFYEIEEVIIQK